MSEYDTDPYRDGRQSREYDPGLSEDWISYEERVPAEELDRRDRLNHEQAYQDLAWDYVEGELTQQEYEAEVAKLNEWATEHGYPTHDPYPEPEPPSAEAPAVEEHARDLAQLDGAEQAAAVPEAPAAAAEPEAGNIAAPSAEPAVTADQLGAAVEAAQGAAGAITARAPEVAPAPAPVVEAPQVALGVEPPAPF
ncbi:hypothetical protein ACFV1W_30335 [Kitasatospora sp. NPDC059648]|uniref:hypothetical protein n=1 Tax=Kitasatospora sp. NPDC059648 TaxID=3346894 RepID=UPI0036ADB3D8